MPPVTAAVDPAPVSASERIVHLDVIRGLAVLGILVMNIVEFGLPMRAYDNPAYAGGSNGLDLLVYEFQAALFDGRMRALFSMLFGAGIVLFGQHVESRGGNAADLLLRRCLWLIPFGIIHRFFLQWTGDILYMYGIVGVLAIAFRVLSARVLLLAGVAWLLCFVPMSLLDHAERTALRAAASEATAIEASGGEVPAELAESRRGWERLADVIPPDESRVQAEIDAIRGSWIGVFAYRWDHNHRFQSAFLYYYFVFDVMGMVLLGMGLMKLGFFSGRWLRAAYVSLVVAGGLVATGSFLLAWAWADAGFESTAIGIRFLHDLSYPFARLIVGLAWASAAVLVLQAGLMRTVTSALAAVGRMAFSNYVLQTVLCTTLFFGWGFGWYGSLSRAQTMLVMGAVSAVQVAWSVLWLGRFRFGPLEWCWRALTYWQRPPMRRALDQRPPAS